MTDIDPGFARGVAKPHLPRDPWGFLYYYRSDGESYVLGSFGPYKSDTPDPNLLARSIGTLPQPAQP